MKQVFGKVATATVTLHPPPAASSRPTGFGGIFETFPDFPPEQSKSTSVTEASSAARALLNALKLIGITGFLRGTIAASWSEVYPEGREDLLEVFEVEERVTADKVLLLCEGISIEGGAPPLESIDSGV